MKAGIRLFFSRSLLIFFLFLFGANFGSEAFSQGFGNRLKLGFGGGVNLANPVTREAFSVYEDLSGEVLGVSYEGRISRPGSQYFFQADFSLDPLIISIRPGTYSYNFYRNSTLVFESEELDQTNEFLLRYFNIPLEVKYSPLSTRIQPYVGAGASYGRLMRSMGIENQAFISSRFTASVLAGVYYELEMIHLNLQAGYNKGLHIINTKNQRFQTGLSDSYALADLVLDDLTVSLSLLFSLEKSRFTSNRKCKYPMR